MRRDKHPGHLLPLLALTAMGLGEGALALPVSATDPGAVRVAARVVSPGGAWGAEALLRGLADGAWKQGRTESGAIVVTNHGRTPADGEAGKGVLRIEVSHLAN